MALFPPVVASSMPAFGIKDQGNSQVKIYYTLSNYNQQDIIKNVHVSIRQQDSNANLVNNNSEILIKSIEQDQEDELLNRYYITITDSDLIVPFKTDTLYKVQLRFSSVVPDDVIGYSAKFFTDNIQKFSQWSTVCLIKPIKPPVFYIDDFYYDTKDEEGQDENATDSFLNSFADFIGVYKADESSEVLKSWRLRLYNNDDILLGDTDWNLISSYNYTLNSNTVTFKCSLPYEFQDSQEYYIIFDILTKNNYTDSKIYHFTTTTLAGVDENELKLNSNLSQFTINEEEGYVKLLFAVSPPQKHNLVIRRSDSQGNFLNWTDLKIFQGKNNTSFLYYDFTVESGIAYQYLIQVIDERGRYTYHQKVPTVFIVEWEHAFLLEKSDSAIRHPSFTATDNDFSLNVKQLKLKYDFQISSYKTNITENLTNTIGGKYPFIRRNGNNYYRSFPISGTITYYMDNVNFFTNPQEMFGDYSQFKKYQDINEEIKDLSSASYSYIYERKFREEVEKFLYNNKPKLYKSTQEGNILIKLMEVSFTPKAELDRLIYTFSATAYQIGEPSIQNLCYYGFISRGLIDPSPEWGDPSIGQISSYQSDENPFGNIFKAGEDIIGGGDNASNNSIAKKYHYKESLNGQVLNNFYLNHLKITMESDPYLIIEDSPGHYRVYDDIKTENQYDVIINETRFAKDPINFGPNIKNPLYRLESTYTDSKGQNNYNIYLGYLFKINGEPIIISSNGVYELKDTSLKLPVASTSIVPKKDCLINLDYKIYKTFITDLNKVPTRIIKETKVGQLMGTYLPTQDLISLIKNKYISTLYITNQTTGIKEKTTRKVNGIIAVKIEAEPRTKIKIHTNKMEGEPSIFIMNETGVLNIDFSNETEEQIVIDSLTVEPPENSFNTVTDVMVLYTIKLTREYFNIS